MCLITLNTNYRDKMELLDEDMIRTKEAFQW